MSLIGRYLDHQHPDRLFRSAVYDDSDRSEKGAVSYYLGLVIAKLLAERLLGAVQVWHYDRYRPLLTNPGRLSTRPDLLAESILGDRYLIEGKGRTNGYTAVLVASAHVSVVAESTADDVRTYEGVRVRHRHLSGVAPGVLERRRPLSPDPIVLDLESQGPGRTLLDRDGHKWSLGLDRVAVRLGETWRADG